MGLLAWVVLTGTIIFLLFVAAWDFAYLQVRNRAVLFLLVCYGVIATDLPRPVIVGDLAAGVLLFVICLGFWAAGMMGGGDAKLALPVGFLVGWTHLSTYALCLLVFSIAFLVALRNGQRLLRRRSALGRQVARIMETGRTPFAVPMGFSAAMVIAARFFPV